MTKVDNITVVMEKGLLCVSTSASAYSSVQTWLLYNHYKTVPKIMMLVH